MGKARIVGGGSDGLYQAIIEYDTERLDARVAEIDQRLSAMVQELLDLELDAITARDKLDALIYQRDVLISEFNAGNATIEEVNDAQSKIHPAILPYQKAKNALDDAKFRKLSLTKERQLLTDNKPNPQQIDMWCADLTESLSIDQVVPTIEVNGEGGAIIIGPQFSARNWNGQQDGALQPVYSSGPMAVWFNWALLPAWQKWKPTYRVGVITAINLDRCNVALDEALSSQQSLPVNQSESLQNVPIKYMDCDAGAFDVGDRVVVQFEGQSWAAPKVVGFESNPKPCAINDFLTIPRSDAAPSGWGLPATDGAGAPINNGLGTEGGANPWVKIRTANYGLTRFVQPIEHGNLYFKSKNYQLPILSWKGPENGYLFNGAGFTTFGIAVATQQAFGRDLYCLGKKVAESDLGRFIAGAAIRVEGAGYRMYLATVDSENALRLEYADVQDLEFTALVPTWTAVAAPSNPETADGKYKTDGVISFNQSGTKCAWVWAGRAYQWTIASNTISDLGLSQSLPDVDEPKPMISVSDEFSDFVSDPCGGPDPWPRTIKQTETLNQDWVKHLNRQKNVAAVDYSNDQLVVLWKQTGTLQAEAFSYSSTHTHTREVSCGAGYPKAMETLSFDGTENQRAGFHFSFDGLEISQQSETYREFAGGPGELRGVSATLQDPNNIMRVRVEGAQFTTKFEWVERESYIRHADIKGQTAIVTAGETIYVGDDVDGMRLWNQTRRHYLLANGAEHDFWTEDFGTHREEDILDINGNIIVYDPRYPALEVNIASDRYSQKVFASVSDENGATLINYLTDSDPVTLTEIYGANPRFSPITIV